MPTTINIYGNPGAASWRDIEAAVKMANGLQTDFVFKRCEQRTHLAANDKTVDLDKLSNRLANAKPKMDGLFFCEGPFDNEILVNELLPDRILVSCDVDKGLESPPFRLYLLYQIAAAALTLSSQVNEETNDEMGHDSPIGCLWDWWTDANERSAAMVAARICPKCKNALRTHGTATEASISACQQILDYIRRTMMGESPEIANRVFIAYGHGDDWKVLRDMLNKWGLEVDHFNAEPVAGVLTAERWRQMMNRARFAFAVMTPDDKMEDGTRRARQNVVHEIGLCHARLGLHSTAILLARDTQKFSNVDGVNYISFESGKLAAREGEIRKVLVERGIL